MKLKDWAKSQKISYKTAWRWHKAGLLPVESYQVKEKCMVIINPNKKKGEK